MPLLGRRRSALPSQRRKLRQKAVATGRPYPTLLQTGDGPTQVGFLLDSDTPLLSCCSLKIQENPGPSFRTQALTPVPAGSVFIPLAFKPKNFYQKQAHAERNHVCHNGKLPHQASEV